MLAMASALIVGAAIATWPARASAQQISPSAAYACDFENNYCDFEEQSKVINAASDILVAAFGDAGKHARSAVGLAELPHGIPVEINGEFELRS